MKTNYYILFLLVLLNGVSFNGQAQSCQDGFTFTTQEQIDLFSTEHPNCISVNGDIWIDGSDITSLAGLSQIFDIHGDLIITNTSLTTLDGLNPATIGQFLESVRVTISGNPNLTSFGSTL